MHDKQRELIKNCVREMAKRVEAAGMTGEAGILYTVASALATESTVRDFVWTCIEHCNKVIAETPNN